MTVIKLCGIAVIGVCAALIMRAAKSELAMPVGVITGIIILASAISSMYPIVAFAEELSRENSYSLYFSTVLKALGIAERGLWRRSWSLPPRWAYFCSDCLWYAKFCL